MYHSAPAAVPSAPPKPPCVNGSFTPSRETLAAPTLQVLTYLSGHFSSTYSHQTEGMEGVGSVQGSRVTYQCSSLHARNTAPDVL